MPPACTRRPTRWPAKSWPPPEVPAAGSYAALDPQDFVDGTFGLPTVQDIMAELDKPGRDPRPAFAAATFSEGIEKISDLRPGMVLEGTVTNVRRSARSWTSGCTRTDWCTSPPWPTGSSPIPARW